MCWRYCNLPLNHQYDKFDCTLLRNSNKLDQTWRCWDVGTLVPLPFTLNSLAPRRCGSNFKSMIFKLILQNNILATRGDIALRWMPQNLTNGKLTSVQEMAWCCQVTSHYVNQCWPRSMSPYCLNMPQWVLTTFLPPWCHMASWIDTGSGNGSLPVALNSLAPGRFSWHFRWVIFILNLFTDDWYISCEIAIRWMQLDLADDKSTLV